MFTVITENDISQWEDQTGVRYHFPARYLKFLKPGTKVIYYKGRITDKKFTNARLSSAPHYFGIAKIGKVVNEEGSTNYYADIEHFSLFLNAVPFKIGDATIETIPISRRSNYWRDGVRPINERIY